MRTNIKANKYKGKKKKIVRQKWLDKKKKIENCLRSCDKSYIHKYLLWVQKIVHK